MAITVKNLINELSKLNQDDFIVLSSDPEGNSYGFLEGIAINQKLQDGDVYLAKLTDELKEQGYTEDDVSENGISCVVFYPGVDTTLLETIILAKKGNGVA